MTRPSAGKAGTHGCFMVEVTHAGTRAIARRFITREEAKDFYDRTVAAHQQKANREQRVFHVALFETRSAKSPVLKEMFEQVHLLPH